MLEAICFTHHQLVRLTVEVLGHACKNASIELFRDIHHPRFNPKNWKSGRVPHQTQWKVEMGLKVLHRR